MAQHITDPGNLRPRNFRVPGFQFFARMPAGLNPALNRPVLALIEFQALERHARQFAADKLDGLYDVGEACDRRWSRHQNTCNAEASICARRTGCKLRRVMMPVLRPRIRAAASFTSINSKSPRDPSG